MNNDLATFIYNLIKDEFYKEIIVPVIQPKQNNINLRESNNDISTHNNLIQNNIDLGNPSESDCQNQFSTLFLDNIKKIKTFIDKFNKLPSYSNDKYLYGWIANQRHNYKNGKLDIDQISILEFLSGWSWNPLYDNFEEKFFQLKKFIESNNRLPLSTSESSLYGWIMYLRSNYRFNKLDGNKVDKLNTLPNWSWN